MNFVCTKKTRVILSLLQNNVVKDALVEAR